MFVTGGVDASLRIRYSN